jgi:hypothetical protein
MSVCYHGVEVTKIPNIKEILPENIGRKVINFS